MAVTKAVVLQFGIGGPSNSIAYQGAFLDFSNSIVEWYPGNLTIGVDITTCTLDDLRNGANNALLAYATMQGYSITANDIYYALNLLSPNEVASVKNGISKSFSAASRSLNTVFQPSTTRDCIANYSVDIAATISLTTGQTGTVFLEYADNNTFTTNVVEVCRFVNGNTGSLTIGLNLTQNVTGTLSGVIPAGKYVRIRTANTVGTPTFTYRSGQEVLV